MAGRSVDPHRTLKSRRGSRKVAGPTPDVRPIHGVALAVDREAARARSSAAASANLLMVRRSRQPPAGRGILQAAPKGVACSAISALHGPVQRADAPRARASSARSLLGPVNHPGQFVMALSYRSGAVTSPRTGALSDDRPLHRWLESSTRASLSPLSNAATARPSHAEPAADVLTSGALPQALAEFCDGSFRVAPTM